LSARMGCIFSSGSWPFVKSTCTAVNFFGLLSFGLFYFSWPFFLNPNLHTTLPPYYPTHLLTLFT
jgi:hypothetical protein